MIDSPACASRGLHTPVVVLQPQCRAAAQSEFFMLRRGGRGATGMFSNQQLKLNRCQLAGVPALK